MNPSPSQTSITFDRSSFIVDGQRRILLIGTMNYFRMHPCDWEHRLHMFKQSGFNTVDVYVAWGFHEQVEGEIDFESPERNLDRYLRLCGEMGLWVYLRPGPYICNEFDGGGLPPWLHNKPGVEVRQNELNYLAITKRYLAAVNRIAVRHQRSRGGPVILYAIENELDFYPTRDVAGYMTALRDFVRADGIEVPLTACIGNRTPVAKAMGLIDGVIPTPNIYVNGEQVEAQASLALSALRDARSLSGRRYDVPPFVTEMGRDENSLRRIFSCGFKGLGPFNFAGGSNWDRFQAVNNWGDYKQLATSIDFGGMIRFDGVIGQTYFDARRLARFIACVEPELCLCEPAESIVAVEGGPVRAHVISDGRSHFAFLPNLGDTPVELSLQAPGGRVPRCGTFAVPPRKTAIITLGLSLERFGVSADIDYCTAEFWSVTSSTNGVRIELALPIDAIGELAINDSIISVRPGDRTAVVIGKSTIDVVGINAQEAERGGVNQQRTIGRRIDLAGQEWSAARTVNRESTRELKGPLRSLEELGVYHGAGEYEIELDAMDVIDRVGVAYAADTVALWTDGQYHGTRLADGNACTFDVRLHPGRHQLRFRATCWGRPCFHDERWPAAKLGSKRGLVGELRINDKKVDTTWRFTPDPIACPVLAGKHATTLSAMRFDQGDPWGTRFILDSACPFGAVLEMSASNLECILYVNGFGVGRMAFDSLYRFTGGPPDRLLIPGALLASAGAELTLWVRGTQAAAGAIQGLSLHELVEI